MVGNLWGIVVTGAIGFVAFYSVLVIVNNNMELSESKENPNLKVKGMPRIDPGFLMGPEFQKGAEIWLPAAYFSCNVITTLLLKHPLM